MAQLLETRSVHHYGHRSAWRPSMRNSCVRSRTRQVLVKAEQKKQKVVAVLYKAGKAAENKDLLGCVENELGLRKFLEDQVALDRSHATLMLLETSSRILARSCRVMSS